MRPTPEAPARRQLGVRLVTLDQRCQRGGSAARGQLSATVCRSDWREKFPPNFKRAKERQSRSHWLLAGTRIRYRGRGAGGAHGGGRRREQPPPRQPVPHPCDARPRRSPRPPSPPRCLLAIPPPSPRGFLPSARSPFKSFNGFFKLHVITRVGRATARCVGAAVGRVPTSPTNTKRGWAL